MLISWSILKSLLLPLSWFLVDLCWLVATIFAPKRLLTWRLHFLDPGSFSLNAPLYILYLACFWMITLDNYRQLLKKISFVLFVVIKRFLQGRLSQHSQYFILFFHDILGRISILPLNLLSSKGWYQVFLIVLVFCECRKVWISALLCMRVGRRNKFIPIFSDLVWSCIVCLDNWRHAEFHLWTVYLLRFCRSSQTVMQWTQKYFLFYICLHGLFGHKTFGQLFRMFFINYLLLHEFSFLLIELVFK